MKCHIKKLADSNSVQHIEKEKLSAICYPLYAKTAFSLVEVVTALIILSLVCSSVLLVINRCLASAAESALRMQALEVARENMENVLASDSVQEMAEYGSSDKYPDILWKTTVESFYEPVNSKMWIRAVCSADYTDTAGQTQTIELTHWLTDLTKEQEQQLLNQQNKPTDLMLATEELAAAYAGVDTEAIRRWVANGMPVTQEGYSKGQLDLFKRTGGSPTEDQIMQQTEADKLMLQQQAQKQAGAGSQGAAPQEQGGPQSLGLPSNWDQMSPDEQIQWLDKQMQGMQEKVKQ